MTEGKTARGASSPAKPALTMPEPLSHTRAATSSSAIVVVVGGRVICGAEGSGASEPGAGRAGQDRVRTGQVNHTEKRWPLRRILGEEPGTIAEENGEGAQTEMEKAHALNGEGARSEWRRRMDL